MSTLTDAFENKLYDFLNRGQSLTIGAVTATWSAAPTYYIGLLTVLGDDIGGHTECTGVNYARVALAASLSNITGTDGGVVSASTGTDGTGANAAVVQFAVPGTGGWGTAVGFARFDALTAGNVVDKVLFSNGSWSLPAAADVKFAIGALLINVALECPAGPPA